MWAINLYAICKLIQSFLNIYFCPPCFCVICRQLVYQNFCQLSELFFLTWGRVDVNLHEFYVVLVIFLCIRMSGHIVFICSQKVWEPTRTELSAPRVYVHRKYLYMQYMYTDVCQVHSSSSNSRCCATFNTEVSERLLTQTLVFCQISLPVFLLLYTLILNVAS